MDGTAKCRCDDGIVPVIMIHHGEARQGKATNRNEFRYVRIVSAWRLVVGYPAGKETRLGGGGAACGTVEGNLSDKWTCDAQENSVLPLTIDFISE